MKRIVLVGLSLFVLQSCGLYPSNGISRQSDSITNTTIISCKQKYYVKKNNEIYSVSNEFVLESNQTAQTFTSFFDFFTIQDFGKIDSLVYVKINGKVFTKMINDYYQGLNTETKTDTETIKDKEDKKVEIVTGLQSNSRLMHQFKLNYSQEELLEFKNIETLSFQFYKNKKPIIIDVKASDVLLIRNLFSQKLSN
jgi:hypothetical protein